MISRSTTSAPVPLRADPRSTDRPDLVLEVVWTSGGLDKLEIYRRLAICTP